MPLGISLIVAAGELRGRRSPGRAGPGARAVGRRGAGRQPTPPRLSRPRGRWTTSCRPTVPAAVELPAVDRRATRCSMCSPAPATGPSCAPAASARSGSPPRRSSPRRSDACVDRGVAVKCTAGLHHAVRHTDPATGFEHHGFLNVLLAASALAEGASTETATGHLRDPDAARPGRGAAHLAGAARQPVPGRSSPHSAPAACSSRSTTWSPSACCPPRNGSPRDHHCTRRLARPPRRHRLRDRQPALRRLLHARHRAARTGVAIGDFVLDLAAATGDAGARHRLAQRLHGARTGRVAGAADPAHRLAHRPGPPGGRRAAPASRARRSPCTCPSRSPTTSTSTAPSTTRRTSAGCSGRTPRR